jgi:hypothetical protein
VRLIERLRDRLGAEPLPELALRPPLWHPGFPFVLAWSHKAASTALAQWFFAQIGSPHLPAGDAAAAARYRGLGIHAYQFKVHCAEPGYLRRAHAAMQHLPVIKFVRDPAARAFSAFLAIRREAVLRKPGFWGARVNAELTRFLDPARVAPEIAYGFGDFLDWLEATPPAAQNNHVRAQRLAWEGRVARRLLPVEELTPRLLVLESAFGLQTLASTPGLLDSGHHRSKGDTPEAQALERWLLAPAPVGAFERGAPPAVDSRVLAGTELGERLRVVFAADYADWEESLRAT